LTEQVRSDKFLAELSQPVSGSEKELPFNVAFSWQAQDIFAQTELKRYG
jgi:hypothetical protein